MMAGSFNYRYTQEHSAFKVLADYVSKKSEGNNRYDIQQSVMSHTSDTLYRMESLADYQITSAETHWSYSPDKETNMPIITGRIIGSLPSIFPGNRSIGSG